MSKTLKALCFLGTGSRGGSYSETTYVKHDDPKQTHKTHLFPEAISELYTPDKIIVFVTPDVKQGRHLPCLKKKLGCKLEEVDLPPILDGGNAAADLWKIFNIYVESVNEKDKIILDITHAFRSLPLLAVPVVAYLRQVEQVTLEHILYAPYDARSGHETKNTQIFDLTQFVDLLDWMNAVEIFQHSGDARPVAKLRVPKDIDKADKINESLTNLSEALLTNLPLEAQKAASAFEGLNLDQDEPSQAPFGILVGSLKETYKGMAVEKPEENLEDSLKSQYEQIKWYVKNRHYFHAITLINEWLVSWECQRARPLDPNWLNGNRRDEARKRLNEYTENHFGRLPEKLGEEGLHTSPQVFPELRKEVRINQNKKSVGIDLHLTITCLWQDCKIIRNRLAHCGMSGNPQGDDPMPLTSISEAVECLSNEIEHLQNIHQQINDSQIDVGMFNVLQFFLQNIHQQINDSQSFKKQREILKTKREQIEWYIDNKCYLHAITLVREWLIAWEFHQNQNTKDWAAEQARSKAIQSLKRRHNQKLSKKLWNSCLEIPKKLSNLKKSLENSEMFQTGEAEITIDDIKTFGGEDGLKKLPV